MCQKLYLKKELCKPEQVEIMTFLGKYYKIKEK